MRAFRTVCRAGGRRVICPGTELNMYMCRDPVDMRKQIYGLALLVQEAMTVSDSSNH